MGWNPASAEEVFAELAQQISSFATMSYKSLGEHGLPLAGASGDDGTPPQATEGADSAQQSRPTPEPAQVAAPAAPVRAFGWRQWSWERKRPWE
jgi:hypothetical protein